MKVLILLSVVALAFASRECGENQHYKSCGTACPLTCDNYANPPRACILMCNPGCHCDEGYVKTSDGSCVRPEECPSKALSQECGDNEHFESCGSACPLTCDNYQNPPKVCVLRCDIGCHCDEGFVRAPNGRCIRPAQCPLEEQQVCGENERYSGCGTACPLTCDNYANPPKICPLMCRIGCECEKGFVKSRDGRCVRPEECPARAALLKTCHEKPETGMCRAYIPLWYYDSETGKCQQFVYGGCGGNGNRYVTEGECSQNCADVQQSSELCSLPAETGLCRGFFPRYHYDKATGQCQRFVYGGCGGNANNFASIEECHQNCA